MTQEQKDLLLKDICARLPYKVKASFYDKEEECETWDEIGGITLDGYVDIGQYGLPIEDIKPYLFPLSRMTEIQKREYIELLQIGPATGIDWLNKNHFDYRGLIEKSLALDATNLNIY